ncbi:MAG: YbaK/EbsC family protein [Gemmatimonadota bacterium]|jgi:Ala-tRNA(Pro) deacylase
MTIATKIEEYLEAQGVKFEVIDHPIAYTAQEEAAASHVPGRSWAKTVEVLLDGRPAICAIPATRRLDLKKLRAVTGASAATLATEGELGELFPDCDLGAMPPFGNLYGQTTFVDEELRESERIAFHAGDHRSAIEIPYAEFERLVEPVPGEFSAPAGERG